ncbi:MAG TPA: hypothetical protein VF553_15690 [Pyrinomonadaceae bacterium]
MNILRQFCAAVTLSLALTFSAFAGEIQTPGIPTSGEMGGQGAASTNEVQSSDATTEPPLMEIALGVLLKISSML